MQSSIQSKRTFEVFAKKYIDKGLLFFETMKIQRQRFRQMHKIIKSKVTLVGASALETQICHQPGRKALLLSPMWCLYDALA